MNSGRQGDHLPIGRVEGTTAGRQKPGKEHLEPQKGDAFQEEESRMIRATSSLHAAWPGARG